jgi:hypothetical protein
MSHFWNIEYADGILDQASETRRMIATYKALYGTDQPHALAALVRAGYDQLVRAPVPSVIGKNTRKSGPDRHRQFGREAA